MAEEPAPQELVETALAELAFEIRWLHERVNALLAAEAFLTIAYTAAMAADGAWARVVAPVLALLGLVLAAVAWPGVRVTTRLVHLWTARLGELTAQTPTARRGWAREWEDRRRRESDQRRGSWFFLTVPAAFVLAWVVLLVVALALPR
ncbi:hypothetical protein GCM10027586_03390 [Kineococcus gypseus]